MKQTTSLVQKTWTSIVDTIAAKKGEVMGFLHSLTHAKPEQQHALATEIRPKLTALDLATLQKRIKVKLEVAELYETDPESLSEHWLERSYDAVIINRLFTRADQVIHTFDKHPRDLAGLIVVLDLISLVICNYDSADEDTTLVEEEPPTLEYLAEKCRLLCLRQESLLNYALFKESNHAGDHHAYESLLGRIEVTGEISLWPRDNYPWLNQQLPGTDANKEANYLGKLINVNWKQLRIPAEEIVLAGRRHFSSYLHLTLNLLRGLDLQLANLLM
jgi:hypothetical protein